MSEALILEPTEAAQWHKLLQQAEEEYGCFLDESMESYLVFTLMRFMKDRGLASQAVALDYLRAHGLPKTQRLGQLRNIGDECLLLTGLYPKRAQKRMVRVSYYVDLGRSAYQHISDSMQQSASDLYRELAEAFVTMMDLLQTIRDFGSPALQPLQSLELWSDTGSRRAFASLSKESFPVHEGLIDLTVKQ